MRKETTCLHGGYKPGNGEPMALPVYQSTTYAYESSQKIGDIFDLKDDGHMYSRISNPTVGYVEEKIAALEGGVGALMTTSGQTATMTAVLNILSAGDSLIASAKIYGGSVNLFSVTLSRFGIECIYVDPDADEEELERAIKPNTKAVFAETLANPSLAVCDIEKLAAFAHSHDIPLIIDNTFPTPILCRPFEHGADIIVHSTTKYFDGHAVQIGGCVVDSGNFDWTNGKFPAFTEPDESYHGLIYTEKFGKNAFLTKARQQLIRDMGTYPSASAAFLTDLGLQTLALRMERHSENALAVAKYLEKSPKVKAVNYPGLESNKYYGLAQKYLPDGQSGVLSFNIEGGREKAIRFMDGLKLAVNAVHVADVRTMVLHPASSTHRQLTDEQLVACGIDSALIRVSVGIENIDDILEDIENSLTKA